MFNRARSNTDGINTFPANPYNFAGEYGPASTDVHHRVTAGVREPSGRAGAGQARTGDGRQDKAEPRPRGRAGSGKRQGGGKPRMDIVKTKAKDLNARNDEAAFRIIAGTARQMGLEIVD